VAVPRRANLTAEIRVFDMVVTAQASGAAVPVAMVQVRVVRVPVRQRLVRVLVSVRLAGIDIRRVLVMVVLIVPVAVGVREKLMMVLVLVALGQM
jgi:hypothetical protein